MKIIEYNREIALRTLDNWRINQEIPSVNSEFLLLRNYLTELYRSIKNDIQGKDRKDYLTDVLFGIGLYKYLEEQEWFNLRTAANDGFWRYIAVAVIPHLVSDRWDISKDDYFWKKSNRLWPKTTWWYIHLAYQNTLENTKEILFSKNLNSDVVQGIVDRSGKKGTYIEVYRELILQYSLLEYNTIVKFKKQLTFGSDSLFRAIMRLNTARCLVIDPCLVSGGVEGYVKSLINDLTNKL